MRTHDEILVEALDMDYHSYTKIQLEGIMNAMDEFAKEKALAFYEYEESIPPAEMENRYEIFITETWPPIIK